MPSRVVLARRDGLRFSDSLFEISADRRNALLGDVLGLLTFLDNLWDEGLLPQQFD